MLDVKRVCSVAIRGSSLVGYITLTRISPQARPWTCSRPISSFLPAPRTLHFHKSVHEYGRSQMKLLTRSFLGKNFIFHSSFFKIEPSKLNQSLIFCLRPSRILFLNSRLFLLAPSCYSNTLLPFR